MILSIDFETWASTDLKLGSLKYLTAPDTILLMMAWCFQGEEPDIWFPWEPLPQRIIDHVNSGGMIAGWNSMTFERIAWREIGVKRHDFPEVKDEQWLDIMYLSVAANMPRSLDGAARFVGASALKDDAGHKLMLKLTSPKQTPDPRKIPMEEFLLLAEYCKDDVRAEMATAAKLPNWPQAWPWPQMPAVDRAINDRGILCDIALVTAMQKAAIIETERMDRDMNILTGVTWPPNTDRAHVEKMLLKFRGQSDVIKGKVPKVTNIEGLKSFLLESGVKLKLKHEPVDIENDAPVEEEDDIDDSKIAYRLRKNDIVDLLATDDLSIVCRIALEMRLEAAKASAKKLKKVLEVAGPDGRIRWQLKLFGASQSGRFSGAGVQVHNFLRDCIGSDDHATKVFEKEYGRKPGKGDKDAIHEISERLIRDAVNDALTGDPDYIRMMQGPVLPFISKMMRRILCAPEDKTFIQGDYSAIEARMMSWLCQDARMLEVYASGGDPYIVVAAGIMGVSPDMITKEQRQRGKVSLLAMGFMGGVGALVAMGMAYGMRMTKDEARPIVKAFRESNPELVAFGRAIFNTAIWAVKNPNKVYAVGPLDVITFTCDGKCLYMTLPSGRQIRYWSPHLEGEDDYGNPILTCLQIKGKAIFRRTLWSGIFCENAASGASVDLLAGALTRLDNADLPVVLHVHDGIECEVDDYMAPQLLGAFKAAMLEAPAWSKKGIPLPIAASIHISPRFG